MEAEGGAIVDEEAKGAEEDGAAIEEDTEGEGEGVVSLLSRFLRQVALLKTGFRSRKHNTLIHTHTTKTTYTPHI